MGIGELIKNIMQHTHIYNIMKIWNFTEIKVLIVSIFASIATYAATFSENYLGISGKFALALAILITFDFITGIIASKKLKNRLSSSKGLKTVYKTGAYMIFLYIAFSLQKELPEEGGGLIIGIFKYFHIYLIAHISFWELFSIDENLKTLGVNIGLTDILKNILDKIKNTMSK